MSRFVCAIRNAWRSNIVYRVYNPKNDHGKGRLCMLISGIMSGIVGQLSGGLFYTGFLSEYGLDIVSIGVITFIPSLISLLSIFSPWILEHFKKRKLILACGKLLYYVINIIGITLLPVIVKDPDALLVCFVITIILANAVNALTAPGFSAWHANFLPDNMRMDYFTSSGCINSFISYLIVLVVSVLTDAVKESSQYLVMLTMIRYIAFAFAVIDCLIHLIPKEYPYITKEKAKISNIFTLPFKNKRFLLTILIAASYTFASNLPNATLNAYVYDIGVSYTLANGINAIYFLFFILFTKMWNRFVAKHYWFRAFAFATLMQSVTYFAYAFVNANCIWLYVVVRLSQHVFGVVMNSIIASLPFVNLPEADRTNYLAFNSILSSLPAFLSMMLGTGFTKWMGTNSLHVLGIAFSSTQILLFVCAVAQCLVAFMSIALAQMLTPPEVLKKIE